MPDYNPHYDYHVIFSTSCESDTYPELFDEIKQRRADLLPLYEWWLWPLIVCKVLQGALDRPTFTAIMHARELQLDRELMTED